MKPVQSCHRLTSHKGRAIISIVCQGKAEAKYYNGTVKPEHYKRCDPLGISLYNITKFGYEILQDKITLITGI